MQLLCNFLCKKFFFRNTSSRQTSRILAFSCCISVYFGVFLRIPVPPKFSRGGVSVLYSCGGGPSPEFSKPLCQPFCSLITARCPKLWPIVTACGGQWRRDPPGHVNARRLGHFLRARALRFARRSARPVCRVLSAFVRRGSVP